MVIYVNHSIKHNGNIVKIHIFIDVEMNNVENRIIRVTTLHNFILFKKDFSRLLKEYLKNVNTIKIL